MRRIELKKPANRRRKLTLKEINENLLDQLAVAHGIICSSQHQLYEKKSLKAFRQWFFERLTEDYGVRVNR